MRAGGPMVAPGWRRAVSSGHDALRRCRSATLGWRRRDDRPVPPGTPPVRRASHEPGSGVPCCRGRRERRPAPTGVVPWTSCSSSWSPSWWPRGSASSPPWRSCADGGWPTRRRGARARSPRRARASSSARPARPRTSGPTAAASAAAGSCLTPSERSGSRGVGLSRPIPPPARRARTARQASRARDRGAARGPPATPPRRAGCRARSR